MQDTGVDPNLVGLRTADEAYEYSQNLRRSGQQ